MRSKYNLIGPAGLLFLASSLCSFLNLTYNLICVRYLVLGDYAVVSSILSIIVIATTPFVSVTTLAAKHVSELKAQNETAEMSAFLGAIFRHTFWVSLFIFAGILITSSKIAHFLKFSDSTPVIFLAFIISFLGLTCTTTGILQGLQMFLWLAVTSVAGTVLKTFLAFAFIKYGMGITGALDAITVAVILSFLITLMPIRKIITKTAEEIRIKLKEKYLYLIPVGITALCVAILTNIDIVLVKHYFTPLNAGIYSVSQMIGKIVLFLPGPIAFVMFPKTSALYAQKQDSRKLLKVGLLLTLFLCMCAAIFYNIFPEFTLRILTKNTNPECILLGRIFSLNMTLFAVLNVIFAYLLSINNFKFVKNLVFFTLLQLVLIVLFHHTLTNVLIVIFINSIILLFLNIWLSFKD